MFSDTTRFYETTRVEWRDGFVPSQPKHVFVEVRDLETGRDAFGIGPDQDAAEREAIRVLRIERLRARHAARRAEREEG